MLHTTAFRATRSRPLHSSWLEFYEPRRDPALRLFCFPYAGGGAVTYRLWPRSLPGAVEVCPVQIPGRGRRSAELPFGEIEPLVASVAAELRPLFDRPFAIFGHSMGALIAFELARYLRCTDGLTPEVLFVSGHGAPHLPRKRPETHALPDELFVPELLRLGGTPHQILDDPVLLRAVLPLLRADFKLVETYCYRQGAALGCPIRAFGGADDSETPPEALEPWAKHTDSGFAMRILPGDHFYINQPRDLLEAMHHDLYATLAGLDRGLERNSIRKRLMEGYYV